MAIKWYLEIKPGSKIINSTISGFQNKHHAITILQTDTDSKFRLCKKCDKKIEHIISTWPILAKEHYIKRHGGLRD